MIRFLPALLACTALAGCNTTPGEPLSANAVAVQHDAAGAAQAGEPVAADEDLGPGARRFAGRVPLPPRRPDELQPAVAQAAPAGATVVAQSPQPVALTQVATIGAAPVAGVPADAPASTASGIFPALMQSFSAPQTPMDPDSAPAAAAVATAAPAEPITRVVGPVPSLRRPVEPVSVVARTDSPVDADRPQIVRAAFQPQSTTFNPSTRAYGYVPPMNEDNGFVPLARPDSRHFVPQTVRLSAFPGQRYYAAYTNTEMSCFPQRLRQALNTIAEHYGREVEVTSGLRHHGRRGSYHRRCMAADIRVAGVGAGELARFAKSIEGVNGVGTYRHNNVTHIDIRDYQMSWRY